LIKIILIIVAVFIVYCLIEMIRELRDFRVTKYRICSQKLNGIKKDYILKRSTQPDVWRRE